MQMGRIPDKEKESGLPDRWRAFIDEYFANGFNAFRAAVTVGYSETSHNNAWRILNEPEVQKEINRRFAEFAMDANEILARLAMHARAEYAPYIDEKGEIDVAQMVADGNAHLIKEISYDKYNNKVYKFNDPQTALQLLGKHLKLFTNRTEVSGPNGGPIQTQQVELSPEEELRRLQARQRILLKMLESEQE